MKSNISPKRPGTGPAPAKMRSGAPITFTESAKGGAKAYDGQPKAVKGGVTDGLMAVADGVEKVLSYLPEGDPNAADGEY